MNVNALLLRTSFWVSDFLKGSPIRKPYREICYIQEHSYEKTFPYREKKLLDLLSFARKHSLFYANISRSDLKLFPVMNKLSLIQSYDAIRVAEENIPGQEGPVFIQTTSGSTGVPFRIPQDTQKRCRRVAELKYFGKIVGFKTHDKLIHLRTWNKWQKKTSKQIKKENIIPFDIACLNNENLQCLCELLQSSEAVCLRGYASTLGKLAEYANGKNYSFPHLKIAIAGAETLFDDVRMLYKRVMKSDIISQYANEECGIMAQEMIGQSDDSNPMYLNYASYFFEFLKMNSDEPAEFGELGRIVITDMHNYAFPLIRYDTGDVGMLLPPDEHSHGYPILGKLGGRIFDLTYSTTGIPIYPLTFGRILKHYENIVQWQFVQEGEKEYYLNLILRKEDPVIESVIDKFKEYLGDDAQITIRRVDDIPILASGKRKCVVNNWEAKNDK